LSKPRGIGICEFKLLLVARARARCYRAANFLKSNGLVRIEAVR